MSPGFYTRSFSVFCDLWLFKRSPVRKHIGSWHQQAKDSSCVLQLLLYFSVHSSHMLDPRNFLCYGLFCFCRIYFLSEGHTVASPSAAAASDCALLLSLNCNHSELQWSEGREDVSQHGVPWSWWQVYTRGLGGLLIKLSEPVCPPSP